MGDIEKEIHILAEMENENIIYLHQALYLYLYLHLYLDNKDPRQDLEWSYISKKE